MKRLDELRTRAEKKLQDNSIKSKNNIDNDELLHELEVHQIELEMQNEELKKSLDAQSEITKKYTELFEFAPIGYFTLDSNGRILDLNLAASHMTGYPRNYLANRNFSSLISKENKSDFSNFLAKIFDQKGTHICEVNLNSSEPLINLYLEGKLQEANDSCMIAIVDVSYMKKIEYDYQRVNNDLRESINIKDKLLSIIGHDLRGPLTNILIFFNLFVKELEISKIDKLDKYIHEIIYDTEQALVLLENIITWAKLKTGLISLSSEKINLKMICQKVYEPLTNKANRKMVRIINNIPDEFFILADPNLLMIVLSNLITNAIKFSYPKGIVELDVMNLNKRVEIIIRDNGTGMTPEALRDIFSPGKSQQNYGTANESGSGIGLILCREIITLQGGECWIESRKDRGTAVHFTVEK